MPRRLIVTGDDFGYSKSANESIVRAHREGILTSTSLMVTGAAAADAVVMARQCPDLRVGLHLVLVQGRATAPSALTDERGNFSENATTAGIAYFRKKAWRELLRREIRAQLEAFRATGLELDHVDGHLHLHLHPTVFDLLCEFDVPAMRVVNDPWKTTVAIDRRRLATKTLHAAIFRGLAKRARPKLRAKGVGFADRVIGLLQTGHMTEDYWLKLVPKLPEGLSEIYCHPDAEPDAELRRLAPSDDRPGELSALLSPRVKAALAAAGVELTTYAAERRR